MCGTLLHIVTIVVGKKNYNKGREIVLPVSRKADLSRRPVRSLPDDIRHIILCLLSGAEMP
jgi:hypothetical protein